MIKIADAHCDTLTKFSDNVFATESNSHWSLERFRKAGGNFQIFAIFTPPNISGSSAFATAAYHIQNFKNQKPESVSHITSSNDFDDDKVNIMLSLEGASPIINKIEYLQIFYQLGVRAMGLVWNHRNFVADGIDNVYGLTEFGKEVVSEMENLGILVDASHLNDSGFEDLVKICKKPFFASHSNARSILNHKRNLKDEQIKYLVNQNSFIGLNFYSEFLATAPENAERAFIQHIEHFLNLGAENTLGLGADFDGIDVTPFPGVEHYGRVHHILKSEMLLNDNLIDKILHKNLVNYVKKWI